MSNSGLGTSGQTFNASGGSNQNSQTNPYQAAVPSVQSTLQDIFNAGFAPTNNYQGSLPSADQSNYDQAIANVGQLPNFGPAASQTASNILQTGGDPTGILRQEASNLNPIASENLDPTQTPGMANVLKTIQNDVSNQVNSQFAGAGRSLSGLNEQTLARGESQGEAVPLLNQYNQNFANMLGANQQLGNVQSGAMGNIGQAFNYAQMAPGLAQLNPMTQENLQQQETLQPLNYASAVENLINPIAGLGGTASGSQNTNQVGSGTATNSLLSQLGQMAGLISPVGGLLGTVLG